MKKIIFGIVAIGVVGFGYYAISPLFNTIEVDDELPENVIVEEAKVASGFEKLSSEDQEKMMEEMEVANAEEPEMMDEEMPDKDTPMVSEFTEVMDTIGHPASGMVRVLPTTDGGSVIRFEDFETINGPRLHLYLAKDLDAEEFVDLGPIKGTQGNINYEVPANIDISEYKYVMHWCVPFGVLFNYAEIN